MGFCEKLYHLTSEYQDGYVSNYWVLSKSSTNMAVFVVGDSLRKPSE